MCREAYKHFFKPQGSGAIVSILADFWQGFPLMSHTSAARAGLSNLTKTLAIEWAADGVRINAVAPGVIYSTTAAANYNNPEALFVKERIPARRLGSVEEVSGVVVFLLSPAAAFMTGDTLKMDGGASLYGPMTFQVPEHDKWPVWGGVQEGNPMKKNEEDNGTGRSKL